MNKQSQPFGFFDSTAWGFLLVSAYILLGLLPLILAYAARPQGEGGFADQAAYGAALIAFVILALQPLLSARFRWLERPFGQDALMRFHKRMAILATLLLIAHPLLLAAGHSGWSLLTTWQMPWPIQLGRLALLILIAGALIAIFRQKLPLDYNRWRGAHKAIILVPLLGAVHSLQIGDDLETLPLQLYWLLMIALILGLFVYRTLWVPFFGGRAMRVERVDPESPDVTTLTLHPEDGRPFPYHAGQFWFLHLKREGRTSEDHPFTIASSPESTDTPASSIKHSGNFTNTIAETRESDRARVEGPFGHFTLNHHPGRSFLFIAGGIGITPIMSMLRHLRDTGDDRTAMLLWANRTENDIVFRDELNQMPGTIQTAHILSDPDADWNGARGFITADWIREQAGDLLDQAEIFLCGPPPMMDAVLAALKSLNVPARRIHHERFTF